MKVIHPQEFKVMSLRECPVPSEMLVCETPKQVVEYWRLHIATAPHFNPECECMAVLMLNTRKRVKGHQLLSIGTMDTILVHPREIFRCAIIAAAASIVVIHNLCAATHKLCYVTLRFMCSARLMGLASARHSGGRG
ncbi:MAG: JAB domain-containing protein [Verrucomicrobiota bacterium]